MLRISLRIKSSSSSKDGRVKFKDNLEESPFFTVIVILKKLLSQKKRSKRASYETAHRFQIIRIYLIFMIDKKSDSEKRRNKWEAEKRNTDGNTQPVQPKPNNDPPPFGRMIINGAAPWCSNMKNGNRWQFFDLAGTWHTIWCTS